MKVTNAIALNCMTSVLTRNIVVPTMLALIALFCVPSGVMGQTDSEEGTTRVFWSTTEAGSYPQPHCGKLWSMDVDDLQVSTQMRTCGSTVPRSMVVDGRN